MSDTITLNCLIQGDMPPERVFPIEIDKKKSVGHLITKIRDSNPRTFANVDLKDTELWKINIPLDVSNSDHAIKLACLEKGMDVDIAQDLGGTKLLSFENISNVFAENAEDKHIHIMVARPVEQHRELSKVSQEMKMDKILQNTEIILDSLENLHSKVNSLQRIVFQLHEDTVPRLFIILPEDGMWDFSADALFTRTYRLYFLCEHRRILPNGEEENQVHLAKHEGYKIRQPRQFVEKYGSYIMQIMPYVRIAVYLAQTSMELAPFIGNTGSKLLSVGGMIGDAGLAATDTPIFNGKEYMHRKALEMCANTENVLTTSNYQAVGRMGSVGRPDLRDLQGYLQGIDNSNSLGRLQRVLSKNDVLWVCEAHATTCYADDNIREIQRIISGSSMKGKVFFDSEAYELKIKGLDRTSLASLTRQIRPHLQQIALLKIWFEDIQKSGVSLLDIDFQALLDAAPTIRIVWFSNCTFQSNMFKSRTLFYLQELGVKGTNIGPSGVRALTDSIERNTLLTTLHFKGNDIKDEGLRVVVDALKQNSTLTHFVIEKNGIGKDGARILAAYLKQNTTLTQLNINENNIGDGGVQILVDSLKKNSTLTGLYIRQNNIKIDGARALANLLNQNSVLAHLDIGDNYINDGGAQVIAESLKQNTTLISLELSNNYISTDGVRSLAESLKQNSALTSLILLNNNDIDDDGMRAMLASLKQNTTITKISLPYNINNTDNKGWKTLDDTLKQNAALASRSQ